MAAKKVFWMDVETTGLFASKHAIVQFAYMIEVNGKIVAKKVIFASPEKKEISDKALEITGFTRKELLSWPSQHDLYSSLKKTLNKYIDPYDKEDKFFIGGYNVHFDVEFFRKLFKDHDDDYFGSYFHFSTIDPSRVGAFLEWADYAPAHSIDYKLKTLCQTWGYDLEEAHDALADVEATRGLAIRMVDVLKAPVVAAGGG